MKVFRPSKKECKGQNGKKKTLVCLASGFYPDHVSVSWRLNDQNITDGVATDAFAKKDGDHYKIFSRLRVPIKEWVKPDNEFMCRVSFFDGESTTYHNDTIKCMLI